MLKLLGAVLAAAGCVGAALCRERELKTGVETVEQLIHALALLEGEMSLRAAPMPQLMDALSRRCPGAGGALFAACRAGLERLWERPFERTWETAVDRLPGLCGEGKEILLPLGNYLGRYGQGPQCAAVQQTRWRLEELRARKAEEYRSRSRVCRAVGVTGGAFLILLLI